MQITITLADQTLVIENNGQVLRQFSVSTAAKGAGQQMGSEQTPLGWHTARVKIGDGLPINSVLIARRPTGEIYSPELARRQPERRDWILTRILWLSGLEPGVNRLGNVDSMRRFIYIHGTPDSEPMGVPRSHGCIRMRNNDVLTLFNQVPVGIPVNIKA
ncbi:L,D-transpeptidase [Candidatus Sororendozoicomonas aggregata]|uniref:L,D-transpeptidase n=1 Tax=Candidatus Sororendozoicomonas aggregata TaxID=3073239 RepID=UPI002ED4B7F5